MVGMGVHPKLGTGRWEPAVYALVAQVEAHVEGCTEPPSRFGADVEAGGDHVGGSDGHSDSHGEDHGDAGGDDH